MNEFKNLKIILLLIAIMFSLALIYTFVSCTKTVKNVVEKHDTTYVVSHDVDTFKQQSSKTDTIYKVRTDTIHEYNVYRDSILVKDSIYIKEKNDTLYIYKEKWNTRIIEKHDTLYKAKVDTLYKTKSDTVVIYRFREKNDSLYHNSSQDELVVKEKSTGWKVWLKLGGLFLLIFGGLWLWQKFATKK